MRSSSIQNKFNVAQHSSIVSKGHTQAATGSYFIFQRMTFLPFQVVLAVLPSVPITTI